jgi:hypothetical protein
MSGENCTGQPAGTDSRENERQPGLSRWPLLRGVTRAAFRRAGAPPGSTRASSRPVRARLIVMLSAVTASMTGIVLTAGMAVAAPVPPTAPYPTVPVPAVAGACKDEQLTVAQAQLLYNQAIAVYNRALKAANNGAGSAQAARDAQKAADDAAITLNTAKYAQAACRNTAGNLAAADKNCVSLALEFNRLVDELAITQDLQDVAKQNLDAAALSLAANVISQEDYDAIKTVYEVAELQTQKIQLRSTKQGKTATDAGCKNVDRPVPPPPPVPAPPNPAPSSPAPSDTPSSPAPSDTPSSPAPSDTPSSPAPSDTPSSPPPLSPVSASALSLAFAGPAVS